MEDLITEISPGIKAAYETETLFWTVNGIITQQVFAKNRDFNDTSEALDIDFYRERSLFDRFSMSNHFIHSYEMGAIETSLGRPSGRYGYYSNTFEFKYERDLAQELTMNLLYDNESNRFSGSELADSTGNRFSAEVFYQLNPATTLIASYQFLNRNFDPGGILSDNLISVGVRRKITERLTAEARTGVDYIQSYDDEEYIEPRLTVSLAQEIDEKNKAAIHFSKLYDSTPYSEDLFNSWQAGASWERELSERTSCTASGFYGNGKYAASGAKETILGGSLSSIYALNKNIKVNLGYGYSQVKSNEDVREYTQNKVSAGMKIEF
ncbi:MAG: outer membrane beta-barrel protein [Candidatus Omnitrophota bacterium]